MPTKRTRISRTRRTEGATPAELQWLTGEPQEGANEFWKFVRGAEKVRRCRDLIARYRTMIPPGRMRVLERDLKHWEK